MRLLLRQFLDLKPINDIRGLEKLEMHFPNYLLRNFYNSLFVLNLKYEEIVTGLLLLSISQLIDDFLFFLA